MTYAVIPTEDLRALCIKRNWFTCGSTAQYEKLFYANSHGCPIEEIATIIWLCSDDEQHCRRDILADLKEARADWTKSLTAKELREMPDGTLVEVTEIIRDRMGGSNPGITCTMEVGIREGKKVLYSLPHRSSFLPIRDYKNREFHAHTD